METLVTWLAPHAHILRSLSLGIIASVVCVCLQQQTCMDDSCEMNIGRHDPEHSFNWFEKSNAHAWHLGKYTNAYMPSRQCMSVAASGHRGTNGKFGEGFEFRTGSWAAVFDLCSAL